MDRLTERESTVLARIETLTTTGRDIEAKIAEREAAVVGAREMLANAERNQEEAREQRTASQIRRAQAQAQLEVASDRHRHLDEEYASATGRLESLQVELSGLSSADAQLREQLAQWQADLDSRQSTLEEAEQKLTDEIGRASCRERV